MLARARKGGPAKMDGFTPQGPGSVSWIYLSTDEEGGGVGGHRVLSWGAQFTRSFEAHIIAAPLRPSGHLSDFI